MNPNSGNSDNAGEDAIEQLRRSGRTLLTRRLARDLLPCEDVEHVLLALGFTPSSPDVADVEHQHSHTRLERIRKLTPAVAAIAAVCAEIGGATAWISDPQPPHAVPPGSSDFASNCQHNTLILSATCLAMIAELMDIQLLDYGSRA